MTETTVATDVHQTLDVHGGLAAQVTFDGEQCDLVADFFQIGVSQIFDFFAVRNTGGFANFASAGATNAKDLCQTDFGVLVRWDVDTSDTCHVVTSLMR